MLFLDSDDTLTAEGLAVAELVPTRAEDRAAVSWRHSGDPDADYAPVPVTMDPEADDSWRDRAGR